MFIRESRKNIKGVTYTYYKLVEAFRNENGTPTNRTILDFNASDLEGINPEEYGELATRITEMVYSHKQRLIPLDEHIESIAKKIADKIISKLLNKDQTAEIKEVTIKPETIETIEVRSIGAENIGLETLKLLELDSLLKAEGFSKEEINAAIISIVGRLVKPDSENATYRWLKETSSICELLGEDSNKFNRNRLYEITDKLHKKKEIIENHLVKKEKQLFSLSGKVVLYDLTNTFYEGVGNNSEILKRGRSKEKRSDCKIVTLAMAVDEKGFPKYSKVYAGNVSEPETLKEILKDIQKDSQLKLLSERTTIVMDAGILTLGNIELIKEAGLDYLGVARNMIYSSEEIETMGIIENMINIKEGVKAKVIKGDTENILYCESEGRKSKEMGMKNLFQERYEKELTKLKEGLSKKSCTKDYEKVIEKCGRLKEKYSRISKYYTVEATKDDNGINAIDLKWTVSEKVENGFNGTYFIRTNKLELNEKEIMEIYVMLTKVEETFRFFKSDLGLRPIYHTKDSRIESHLFITVLAYHLLRTIEHKLSEKKINHNWKYILDGMKYQVRVTTGFQTTKGKKLYVRNTSKPNEFQLSIYGALDYNSIPMKSKSIII